MKGYADSSYAHALTEFGEPIELPTCGGWFLRRPVGFSGRFDGMGCYPIFSCREWVKLPDDLNRLGDSLVSFAVVTDPFGFYTEKLLRDTFDKVMVFKAHFVADVNEPVEATVSKHHRYYARKALSKISVEHVIGLDGFLEDWCSLYDELTQRHQLRGIKAFSKLSFSRQLQLPGLHVLRATHEGRTVGAQLWIVAGDVAYSHLAAYSKDGYDLMAAYALYWTAFSHFQGRVRWLNFGAGAGVEANATDGLTQFKRGWGSSTRIAYFCGKIFDRQTYDELVTEKGVSATGYFPAYRSGELV